MRQQYGRPQQQGCFSISSRLMFILGTVLLSSCFLCCGVGMFISWRGNEETKKELAEANSLWDAGRKAEAVDRYKPIIKRDTSGIPSDAEKPTIYQRVIDFELEKGHTASAKEYVVLAIEKKITVAGNNPMTVQMFAEVRSEREKQEAEKQVQREADAKRKQDESAAKEKSAETEYDNDGLVFLKGTQKAVSDEFSCTITGTVVNRRAKTLVYAQITFHVYDEGGAQIGTALANINGLEPGGKWNFKAIALVPNGTRYKIYELSGR